VPRQGLSIIESTLFRPDSSHVGLSRVALRRPYTFIVLALLLPIFGLLVILGTPLQKRHADGHLSEYPHSNHRL